MADDNPGLSPYGEYGGNSLSTTPDTTRFWASQPLDTGVAGSPAGVEANPIMPAPIQEATPVSPVGAGETAVPVQINRPIAPETPAVTEQPPIDSTGYQAPWKTAAANVEVPGAGTPVPPATGLAWPPIVTAPDVAPAAPPIPPVQPAPENQAPAADNWLASPPATPETPAATEQPVLEQVATKEPPAPSQEVKSSPEAGSAFEDSLRIWLEQSKEQTDNLKWLLDPQTVKTTPEYKAAAYFARQAARQQQFGQQPEAHIQ